MFWPSFVLHSHLTICDCLWFTEGFDSYKSEKHFCLNDIDFSVMSRLIENQRLRAIGMPQAGLTQHIVARHFGVHRNTIQSSLRRFRQSDKTRDRQRSCRPRVTSRQQDNHIRLRDRFQASGLTTRSILGLQPIRSRTVRYRLHDRHIRPRRPAISSTLLPRHHASRLAWY